MILKIERKRIEPDIVVLQMAGMICMGSDSQQVEWALAEFLKQNHKKIIFDLSAVTLLDSTGIGILVTCYAKMKKAGGNLRIVGTKGTVEETLKITSVDKIMQFYPSLSEAARDFQLA